MTPLAWSRSSNGYDQWFSGTSAGGLAMRCAATDGPEAEGSLAGAPETAGSAVAPGA
jgi:hypothetical protein